jgi:hypothetical protein
MGHSQEAKLIELTEALSMVETGYAMVAGTPAMVFDL